MQSHSRYYLSVAWSTPVQSGQKLKDTLLYLVFTADDTFVFSNTLELLEPFCHNVYCTA